MNINCSFLPDAARANAVDARMRVELSKSLLHIKDQLLKQVTDEEIRVILPELEKISKKLSTVNKTSSAIFGYYYELVFSMLDNESSEVTSHLIRKLINAYKPVSQFAIKNLSSRDFVDSELLKIYRQSLDNDPGTVYGFLPPAEKDSLRMQVSINNAMNLMQETVPDLYAEITEIITEILLASAPKTKDAPKFDGASSYQLWGAVALNADNHKSDIEMLETLAHECAHCLLFGLTVDEPLVRNDDNERYQSPLRDDPRPMDGIYHATFVAARMHYAMQEVLKSSILTDEQREECKTRLAASRKAFGDGYAVLSEFAEYSDTGREIMQNAREYMQQVASSRAVA